MSYSIRVYICFGAWVFPSTYLRQTTYTQLSACTMVRQGVGRLSDNGIDPWFCPFQRGFLTGPCQTNFNLVARKILAVLRGGPAVFEGYGGIHRYLLAGVPSLAGLLPYSDTGALSEHTKSVGTTGMHGAISFGLGVGNG